jgi:hypothetical protein
MDMVELTLSLLLRLLLLLLLLLLLCHACRDVFESKDLVCVRPRELRAFP